MGFDELVDDQQKKVNILIDAHSQISESDKLKQILKVVLAVGNYLNAKNKNGEANGVVSLAWLAGHIRSNPNVIADRGQRGQHARAFDD